MTGYVNDTILFEFLFLHSQYFIDCNILKIRRECCVTIKSTERISNQIQGLLYLPTKCPWKGGINKELYPRAMNLREHHNNLVHLQYD